MMATSLDLSIMPRVKKRKLSTHSPNDDRLQSLPTHAVEQILSLLGPNERTVVSQTSRYWRDRVRQYCSETPCILTEKRLPVQIGYWEPERVDHLVPIHQIQRFEFLVQSSKLGTLQITFKLLNLAWFENAFGRETVEERETKIGDRDEEDDLSCGTVHPRPGLGATRVEVRVQRRLCYHHGPTQADTIFEIDAAGDDNVEAENLGCCLHERPRLASCCYCTGFWLEGLSKDEASVPSERHLPELDYAGRDHPFAKKEPLDLSLVSEVYLRESLAALVCCARRIAVFPDGLEYPSVDYLVSKLAPHAVTQRYLPAGVHMDPAAGDRAVPLEICYRRPRQATQWFETLGGENHWKTKELRALPWQGRFVKNWRLGVTPGNGKKPVSFPALPLEIQQFLDPLDVYCFDRSWGRLPVEGNFHQLPRDVLEKALFPMLTTTDLTSLGMSCWLWRQPVQAFRGPAPYILDEKRLRPFISYWQPDDADDLTPIHQVQRFAFLVQSSKLGVLEIDIWFLNLAWREDSRRQLSAQLIPDEEAKRQRKTRVEFTVSRRFRYRRGTKEQKIFEIDASGCDYSFGDFLGECAHEEPKLATCKFCTGFFLEGLTDPNGKDTRASFHPEETFLGRQHPFSSTEPLDIPLVSEVYLRESLAALVECARSIESFPDGHEYPSFDYILAQLAPHPVTQRYLPAGVAVKLDVADRDSFLELEYRRPFRSEDWLKHMVDDKLPYVEFVWCTTDPRHLPWYGRCTKKWSLGATPTAHTDPVTFADLPLRHVLPFLEVENLKSVQWTCRSCPAQVQRHLAPGLGTFVLSGERLLTKVGYFTPTSSSCSTLIYQIQPWRFLVKAGMLGVCQVALELINRCWIEDGETVERLPLSDRDQGTQVRYRVQQRFKYRNSSQINVQDIFNGLAPFFRAGLNPCDARQDAEWERIDCTGFCLRGLDDLYAENAVSSDNESIDSDEESVNSSSSTPELTLPVQMYLEESLEAIFQCARCMSMHESHYDMDYLRPGALLKLVVDEFSYDIMRQLPRCDDWYNFDGRGREHPIELGYRFPKDEVSSESWFESMKNAADESRSVWVEKSVEEFPWLVTRVNSCSHQDAPAIVSEWDWFLSNSI